MAAPPIGSTPAQLLAACRARAAGLEERLAAEISAFREQLEAEAKENEKLKADLVKCGKLRDHYDEEAADLLKQLKAAKALLKIEKDAVQAERDEKYLLQRENADLKKKLAACEARQARPGAAFGSGQRRNAVMLLGEGKKADDLRPEFPTFPVPTPADFPWFVPGVMDRAAAEIEKWMRKYLDAARAYNGLRADYLALKKACEERAARAAATAKDAEEYRQAMHRADLRLAECQKANRKLTEAKAQEIVELQHRLDKYKGLLEECRKSLADCKEKHDGAAYEARRQRSRANAAGRQPVRAGSRAGGGGGGSPQPDCTAVVAASLARTGWEVGVVTHLGALSFFVLAATQGAAEAAAAAAAGEGSGVASGTFTSRGNGVWQGA